MITDLAPAKVNLCLYVGPLRESDGKHEVVSVKQSISLQDSLTLRDWDGPGDRVDCPAVPGPNLALAALAAFRDATGWDGPAQLLEIDKRVPIAGGLGGGSGDAAAALRMIAARAQLADPEPLLLALAAQLGADVASQVRPGRVLATGAGERVERLPDPGELGVLVVPSHRQLRTPEVYAEADRLGIARDMEFLADAHARLKRETPPYVNDLEAAAVSLMPELADELALVSGLGARGAIVSGSGPTVLGFFDTVAQADEACAVLAGRQPAATVAQAVAAQLGAASER